MCLSDLCRDWLRRVYRVRACLRPSMSRHSSNGTRVCSCCLPLRFATRRKIAILFRESRWKSDGGRCRRRWRYLFYRNDWIIKKYLAPTAIIEWNVFWCIDGQVQRPKLVIRYCDGDESCVHKCAGCVRIVNCVLWTAMRAPHRWELSTRCSIRIPQTTRAKTKCAILLTGWWPGVGANCEPCFSDARMHAECAHTQSTHTTASMECR